MLSLALLLAVLIGVTIGLLGGGGSLLTLPLCLYALHMEPRQAIASSLFVVAGTSLLAMLLHARAGHVRFREGGLLGMSGMIGASGGAQLARHLPAQALLMLFVGVLIVTGLLMLRPRPEDHGSRRAGIPLTLILLIGVGIGGLSGLVGAGGGFLIVPALTMLAGMPMRQAIATSLLVIALQSFAGFASHAQTVSLDWRTLGLLVGATMSGSLLGAQAAGRMGTATLRRGFAGLILGVALLMLSREVAPWIAALVGGFVSVLALGLLLRKPAAISPPPPSQGPSHD